MNNIYTSRKVQKNNYSGKTGVFWNPVNRKWRSNIKYKGIRRDLGFYKDFEDAVRVREIAETACNIFKDLGVTDITVKRSNIAPINICGIVSKHNKNIVIINVQGVANDS